MPSRDRRQPFWSKFVWKDWYASTADLSPEARGAHIDLMAYAATQSPDRCSIPDDDRRLAYAARMRLERWRKVRAQVLAHWTHRPESCQYQQSRLAVDASSYDNFRRRNGDGSEVRPVHGTKGGSTRVSDLGVDSSTESDKAEETERQGNGVTEPDEAPSLPGLGEETLKQWTEGFEWFYQEYPRKIDRAMALKAYLKIRPRTQQVYDQIMDGLRWWKSHEWDGREETKIEYPSTWLNKRRWLDAQAQNQQ
jgi:uncharacterized protein YdaU (DUF1376 family)